MIDVYLIVPTPRMDGSLNNDFDLEKTIISPNPNEGNFTINFNETVSQTQLEVYNFMGQKIHVETFFDVKIKEIELTNLPTGIYSLRIATAGFTINRQIIIK